MMSSPPSMLFHISYIYSNITEMVCTSRLRKAIRPLMIILACLLMTGCYNLRTISTTSIPANAEVMIVHADENHWTVVNFRVSDSLLTAQVSTVTGKVKKEKTVHVYAAPVSAVTIEDSILTVPTANIGKTDYYDLNVLETIGLVIAGVWLSVTIIAGGL